MVFDLTQISMSLLKWARSWLMEPEHAARVNLRIKVGMTGDFDARGRAAARLNADGNHVIDIFLWEWATI